MTYDNKYVFPFSNMSFIYTEFTVRLITGKFLYFLLHIIRVTSHCNRAAVSRNRYGVEKTVDTHKILINAITFYVCRQEI
jgi:hypothetical protein